MQDKYFNLSLFSLVDVEVYNFDASHLQRPFITI